MVMDEAVRTRDGALFDLAAHRLRAHLERAWDAEGGGGVIRSCHARSPDAAAAIHATYTYRLTTRKTIHTTRHTPNGTGTSPSTTPAVVAMPLPPLKPSQQG